uniref:Uncharacterized protein n=1 Tax=Oryza nivara TaxID=4536 RepID=A0A0E0FJJ3_ORYNI
MTVVAPIDGAVETGEEEEGRREGKEPPKLSRQQHATVPDLLIATDLIKSTDTMLASPGSSVSVDNEMTHRGLDG